MPFEIVNDFQETTEISQVPTTNFGRIFGPQSSSVDANGGSITVADNSPAPLENAAEYDGVLLTDTVTLQYISTDNGREVLGEVDLQLPSDVIYVLYDVVPFGDAGDRFLINLEQASPNGSFFGNFGVVEVQIGEGNVPQIVSMDPETGSPFLFEEEAAQFEIYGLGDGRVGYSSVDDPFNATRVEEIGIIAEGDTGLGGAFAAFFEGQGQDAFFIALPDGGALQVHYILGGESFELELTQLDANGSLVEQSMFSPDEYPDVTMGDLDDPVVLVDEDGNIEIRITGEADGPGADPRFIIEYALADVPAIEPPLPPVEDGIPTEGNDVLEALDEGGRLFALGGNDTIEVLGPDSTVFGGAGDDTFDVVAPDSKVYGDEGDDSFTVDGPDSTVFGGAGDDTISMDGAMSGELFGGAGQDWIIGGDGNDSIDGGDGDDVTINLGRIDPLVGGLFGGDGDDSINGRGGADWISGGAGNDDLRGGDGDDYRFYYLNGDQSAGLSGGDGNDFMRGNHGDDELRGGNGNDNMNGGFGNDVVIGDAGDDKVSGFDGDDYLFGGIGNDVLHGGRGNDTLEGSAGEDVLRGAQGDDTLMGEGGDDQLIGGEGADVFHYENFRSQGTFEEGGIEFPNVVRVQDNGTDTIKDFTIGEDKISIDSEFITFADPDESFELEERTALSFDDIFLSQEDSAAVIQFGETTIRLKGVEADDLSEDDFLFGP